MNLILSVVLGAVVGCIVNAIPQMRNDITDLTQTITAGMVMGAVNYLAPFAAKHLWLSLILCVVMLTVNVVLIRWWLSVTDREPIELVPFLLLVLLMFLVGKATASAMCASLPGGFIRSVVRIVPLLIAIGTVGIFVYSLLVGGDAQEEGKDEE